MRGFIVGTIVTAIAFFVLAEVLPTYTSLDFVTYDGDFVGILVISIVFGLVNGLIGTVVRILALPIRMMTLMIRMNTPHPPPVMNMTRM